MTKEEASDLKSLIQRVVDAEKSALAADYVLQDARHKLEAFLYNLQKPTVHSA